MAVIVNFKIIMDSGNNPGSTCTVKEVLSCCEAMPSQEDGSQSLELRLPGSALLGRLAKLHWARVGGSKQKNLQTDWRKFESQFIFQLHVW